MKKSDWALILLIVTIVGIASYFVVDTLLPTPGANPETVETAEAISSSIVTPDATVFGEDAINPTVKITVGNQGGEQPFILGSQ